MPERFLREFHCRKCEQTTFRDLAQSVALLRSAGMLRRVEKPDQALVDELLSTGSDRMRCPSCGEAGLEISEARDEFDWPDEPKCERCGSPIPRERLEVLPDAKLCVQCQSAGDSGQTSDAPEFCPRCGGLMRLQQAGGSGLARYAMKCSDCGMKS